VVVEILDVD